MTNQFLSNNNCPYVSVVLPIYNEENLIEKSLGALLRQNYFHDQMEIIIADGMSTDTTREKIEKLKATTTIRMIVVDNPRKIAPTGLNKAIKISRGEIIIRIDGHTIVEPDYLYQCVFALATTDAWNVGGKMNAVSTSNIGKAISLATSSPFGVGNARFHYSDKEEYVDTVYLGAWRREIFEQVGLFNEEFVRNQDDEFNYRLREMGGKILLSPKIRSRYFNRSSFKTLWRQYFQYGFWKVRVLQLHPFQMSLRQLVPLVFVVTLVSSAIFSIFSSLFLVIFLGVILLYLFVNSTTSIMTARRGSFDGAPHLVATFAILHVSYGLGMLVGLLRFWRKWNVKQLIAHWRTR